MRLQTEPPPWVGLAIIDRETSVLYRVRAVHRLEVKECEGEANEPFWLGPRLREDEFQLITRPDRQLCPSLGADAYPIDPRGWETCAIGLDGDLEPGGMESLNERTIELE